MTQDDIRHLKSISHKARQQIVNLTTKGGCFLGSALSCLDIIAYLYERFLILEGKDRDYFFLSKGHAVPALYSVLSIEGIVDINWFDTHLSPYSDFYYHPNINISGIDFHSGSLGHLPSVALGVALDMKLRNSSAFSVVLVGDGELNEGSVWETLLIAGAKKINNYIVIIDRNRIQANMQTESLIPLEPLSKKLEAFGFDVYEVDGHDFEEMERVIDRGLIDREKPSAIIAHTVRGKGISRFENRIDKWFVRLNEDEADEIIRSISDEYSASSTCLVKKGK